MGIVLLDSNNVFFDEKIVLQEFLPAYKKWHLSKISE